MGLQQKGADYDCEVAADLHHATTDRVRAVPHRGSGNVQVPCTDVLVTTPTGHREIELKRHSLSRPSNTDRISDARAYVLDDSDVEELLAVQQFPDTTAWFGCKVTRCELFLVRVPNVSDVDEAVEKLASRVPDEFQPHVTDAGSLRVTKPETDEWPTSTSGRSDAEVILETLGIALKSRVFEK